MNIGERIVDLRSENGMTRVQLAEKLGIPMTTLRNYEIGTREPGHKFILDVAHVFNVTTDYLLGMTDEPNRNIAVQNLLISKEEMEGIKKYRALDEHGKEIVELVLDKELERVNTQDDSEVCFDRTAFRISEQPAAAGNGVYLGPESFYSAMVRSDALPRNAAFGVPVSGDSMEPKFHDGDILIVSTEKPQRGEVGIYTMDGQGYVKVLGNNELISINPDYAPIRMTEDIICNGKVIGVLDKDDVQY